MTQNRASTLRDKERIIADLRKKYGADLPVLTEMPSAKEVAENKSRIEFWTGALGYQRGMWKTWDGRLLALIVIPAVIAGHLSFWGPKFETAYEYAEPYIESVQEAALELSDNLLAFGGLPNANQPIDRQYDGPIAALLPEIRPLNTIQLTSDEKFGSLTVWRVTRSNFPPIDGGATKVHGGRWSPPGWPVVYTADSPLGALDEVVFYLRKQSAQTGQEILIEDLTMHRIEVEGTIELAATDFTDVNDHTDWTSTRRIGLQWLESGSSPIFAYASSFSPSGYNYILDLSNTDLSVRVVESFPIGRMRV